MMHNLLWQAGLLLGGAMLAQGCTTSHFLAETARAMQERSIGSADPTIQGAETHRVADGAMVTVLSQEHGEASWYGAGAHGRRTASGEIFDRFGMTAAHRTLPMDSVVRVTNLGNGRQITLRVNDRGPWGEGRIIDVSERAAELLGFKSAGLAQVRVELIEPVAGQAASAGTGPQSQ